MGNVVFVLPSGALTTLDNIVMNPPLLYIYVEYLADALPSTQSLSAYHGSVMKLFFCGSMDQTFISS